METILNNNLKEYTVKSITEENYIEAFEIYNTNQAFFMLTEGKKGTVKGLLESANALPPNFSKENKFFLGLWKDNTIIAILDLLAGYPDENCLWIGLLLVHGKSHNQHIGRQIENAVFQTSKDLKYEKIQLGVIENNLSGLAFWKKRGFKVISKRNKQQDDGSEQTIIIMEKIIK